MKSFLNDLYEVIMFLIPHFVTEDVAVVWGMDGELTVVCSMDAVEPDETFDGVARVQCFTLFGWAWFYKFVDTKVRSWPVI